MNTEQKWFILTVALAIEVIKLILYDYVNFTSQLFSKFQISIYEHLDHF